jgi:hypothetical protein
MHSGIYSEMFWGKLPPPAHAAYSSEISVNIYQITLYCILKGGNLHGHWCDNLKITCFQKLSMASFYLITVELDKI